MKIFIIFAAFSALGQVHASGGLRVLEECPKPEEGTPCQADENPVHCGDTDPKCHYPNQCTATAAGFAEDQCEAAPLPPAPCDPETETDCPEPPKPCDPETEEDCPHPPEPHLHEHPCDPESEEDCPHPPEPPLPASSDASASASTKEESAAATTTTSFLKSYGGLASTAAWAFLLA